MPTPLSQSDFVGTFSKDSTQFKWLYVSVRCSKKMRDKQHQISCGDYSHKLYLLTLIDSILITLNAGFGGFGDWMVVSKYIL